MYPLCGRCSLRHLEDCSATPGRCCICRGKGHRLRDCIIWRKDVFIVGIQTIRREIVLVGLHELYRVRKLLHRVSSSWSLLID